VNIPTIQQRFSMTISVNSMSGSIQIQSDQHEIHLQPIFLV
ncbi:MAG: hypothetical protein ACJA0I_001126, partial [Gammaproteobacteria bacterium]